jgi:hypothetical protein
VVWNRVKSAGAVCVAGFHADVLRSDAALAVAVLMGSLAYLPPRMMRWIKKCA